MHAAPVLELCLWFLGYLQLGTDGGFQFVLGLGNCFPIITIEVTIGKTIV